MKLLKEISEKDVSIVGIKEVDPTNYEAVGKVRTAVRAVVFDIDGNISLLEVSKNNYYKLPGGGVEEGENMTGALIRECLEEIGCTIKVGDEVGEVLEYRDQHKFKQVSYCYIAHVIGEKGTPHLEQGEIDEGFKDSWVPFEEAVRLLKESKPTSYNGPFIVMRDLAILEEVRSMRQRKPANILKAGLS